METTNRKRKFERKHPCPSCCVPKTLSNLRVHMELHGYTKEEIRAFCTQRKEERIEREAKDKYECLICNWTTFSQKDMEIHLREMHEQQAECTDFAEDFSYYEDEMGDLGDSEDSEKDEHSEEVNRKEDYGNSEECVKSEECKVEEQCVEYDQWQSRSPSPKPGPIKRPPKPVRRCPECNRFVTVNNLKKHLRDMHRYSDGMMEAYNAFLREEKQIKFASIGGFLCSLCEHPYVRKSGVEKHIAKCHAKLVYGEGAEGNKDFLPTALPLYGPLPRPADPPYRVLPKFGLTSAVKPNSQGKGHVYCPTCELPCLSIEALHHHYTEVHVPDHQKNDYRIYEKRFENEEEFTIWQDEMCVATCSRFQIINSKRDRLGRKLYYRCSRSGRPKSKPVVRFNSVTKKVVRHCCSFMKVYKYFNGTLDVMACFGHAGHMLKVDALKLSETEKATILSYMEDGLSNQEIMEKVSTDFDSQCRIFYINYSDLRYIRRRMFPGKNDSKEDSLSSDQNVDNMSDYDNSCPILDPPEKQNTENVSGVSTQENEDSCPVLVPYG